MLAVKRRGKCLLSGGPLLDKISSAKPKLWNRNKGINLGSDIPQMDKQSPIVFSCWCRFDFDHGCWSGLVLRFTLVH